MTAGPIKIDLMIQARLGSTRLPGKALLPLGQDTTLGVMIERVKRVKRARQIVLLTTRLPEDEALVELAKERGIQTYQGATDDLLGRFYQAALSYGTDVIVRLTGDCPFMDPAIIDEMLYLYTSNWPRIDFLTNCFQRTYARGLDIEILSMAVLKRLHDQCHESYYREHVVPYLEEHPEEFAVVEYPNATDDSGYRLTLDTTEDYQTITNIYNFIYFTISLNRAWSLL